MNRKDQLVSFNGETIAYDSLGNPTTYRNHTLTWGKIRQLESYDNHTFAYDASGIRTRKDNITYTIDGTTILAETRPTGTIKYLYGTSGVCGFTYNNNTYYYEKNIQGDVTAIYDTAGNKKAAYTYDAWGNHTVTTDIDGIGSLNPFRYRNYYFDTEINLYYLQSRYYDPQIGRFLNSDTDVNANGDIIGFNMFAYCSNNCIGSIDKYGYFASTITGTVTGAIGGVFKGICKGDIGKYAAIGAITGAISGLGVDIAVASQGTLLWVTALLGAVSAFVGDWLTELWINKKTNDEIFHDSKLLKKMLIDSGIGAIIGVLGGAIGIGLSKAFGDEICGKLIKDLCNLLGSEVGEYISSIIFGNVCLTLVQEITVYTANYFISEDKNDASSNIICTNSSRKATAY